MQKLIIHNFGPLQNVELEVKDFMVFIGPQATGKSTVAKLVYYFKDVSNDIWVLFRDFCNFRAVFPELYQTYLEIKLKEKLIEYFGEHIVNRSETSLFFEYDMGKTLSIEIREGTFNLKISEELAIYIENLFEKVRVFRLEILKKHYFTKSEKAKNGKIGEEIYDELPQVALKEITEFLREVANEMFPFFLNNSRYLNFIPAGRILFALNEDNLSSDSNKDYFLNQFIRSFWGRETQNLKDFVQKSNDIISQYISIANKIVKGDISIDIRNAFSLILENETIIKSPFTSSGQQEVIPMVLRLLEFISVEKPIFSIIEEPEAHLYPVAQKYMVDLITLFFHSNAHNQLIITTHSPYILTSLNNLLYAHRMAQSNPEATENIIPKELWLDVNRFAAYYMSDGKIEPIVDREDTHLIYAERLDDVSAQINETYYQLLDLES